MKIGIVVADFNKEITEVMEKKAIEVASSLGAETVTIHVPGVYDIPIKVKKLAEDPGIDAIATLGAVIKGVTKHDEVVVFAVAPKLVDLALKYNKPVALGILGPGISREQAEARKEEYARRAVEAAIQLRKE